MCQSFTKAAAQGADLYCLVSPISPLDTTRQDSEQSMVSPWKPSSTTQKVRNLKISPSEDNNDGLEGKATTLLNAFIAMNKWDQRIPPLDLVQDNAAGHCCCPDLTHWQETLRRRSSSQCRWESCTDCEDHSGTERAPTKDSKSPPQVPQRRDSVDSDDDTRMLLEEFMREEELLRQEVLARNNSARNRSSGNRRNSKSGSYWAKSA